MKKSNKTPNPIKKGRKKHARSIRKGVGNKLPSGNVETHRMGWWTAGDKYHAAPTITFDKKGKKKSQSYKQALEAGEVYEFKKQKRAEKFAAGSWKKGKDKKDAMKAYRKNKGSKIKRFKTKSGKSIYKKNGSSFSGTL